MKKLAKKLTALALALCLLVGALPMGALADDSDPPFIDIIGRHYVYWYHAVEYGLFYGTSPTTMSPDRAVSRSEAVTVLGRVHEKLTGEKIGPAAANTFTDVPEGCYYENYANWAQAMGVIAGYGDSTFRPQRTVTTSELAVMFYRYLKATGKDGLYEPVKFNPQDKEKIPTWALPAAESLSGFGIFSYSYFLPSFKLTRNEAVEYFVNLYEKVAYVIDREAPRQKFIYHLSGGDESEEILWVNRTDYTILTSQQEYQDYLDNLRDPAWTHWTIKEEEQAVPLTVNEQLFEGYNLFAINSIHSGAPAYNYSLVSLEIEGETAHAELVQKNPAGSTADSTGVLTFLAVPKTVTNGDATWYSFAYKVRG